MSIRPAGLGCNFTIAEGTGWGFFELPIQGPAMVRVTEIDIGLGAGDTATAPDLYITRGTKGGGAALTSAPDDGTENGYRASGAVLSASATVAYRDSLINAPGMIITASQSVFILVNRGANSGDFRGKVSWEAF